MLAANDFERQDGQFSPFIFRILRSFSPIPLVQVRAQTQEVVWQDMTHVL
jgi:hypothetical protein